MVVNIVKAPNGDGYIAYMPGVVGAGDVFLTWAPTVPHVKAKVLGFRQMADTVVEFVVEGIR